MTFRFGPFELDEKAAELRRDGEPVAIQPKPLELLRLLVRSRERIVPLDELFEALWPGTIVTPSSLTRAVSHARRAVDDTNQGRLIRSHPRRGYRFTGEVVEIDPGAAHGTPSRGESGAQPAAGAGEGAAAFVGRAAALEELREAWLQAEAGRGGALLVTGPPGIGKTRLVERFADELTSRGANVLVGRCRAGEGVPAFWLWAQILRQLVELAGGGDDLRELAGRAGELAGLVPELAVKADPDTSPESHEQSRFLFFDAVARTLARCSRRRPLLLLLEDLQWAGPPSLRLLEHLAFESSRERVLLLGTIRDEPRKRGHALERMLAMLRQQDRCRQIELAGLSRAEVATLLANALGRRAPTDLTSELFARTEGVPLFLREAIRLLEERGDLQHPERIRRSGVALPGHALDIIRRSLDGLSEPCGKIIGAASVIGREFALPMLASVADLPSGEVLDLLDEAVAAGVVEPTPAATASYRFAHALFREAAYEGLSAGSRARLHHRAALRLEQQHAEDPDRVIAELAHHHHQGIAVGDPERAYGSAIRAAERSSELLAYEQTAIHYEQAASALDHCEAIGLRERLDILLALGDAYRLAGERKRRREVYAQAMECARSLGRPRDFARAAIGFCDMSEWAVRDEPAWAVLHAALAAIGDEPSVERVRVTTRLAYLAGRVSRQNAESMARQALALARAAGDPDALQEALYTLHFVIAGPDDLEERAALTRELTRSAAAASKRDPALIALIDVASDRIALGDREAAAELRAEAEVVAGVAPYPGLVWHTRVHDTGLALLQGRFDEAEQLASEAYEIGRRIGHPYAQGCFDAHHVGLARERGEHTRVIEIFTPASARSQGPVHWVKAVLARSQLASGEADEAQALYDELAASDFHDIPRGIRWTNTMVELAHLCVELEDAKRAAGLCAVLSEIEHHHGVLPVPICYGGPVSRCLARLHEMLGRSDEAAQLYEDALESSAALGARPTLSRIRVEYAALLERRGERSRAAELLEQGRQLAEELGMGVLQ